MKASGDKLELSGLSKPSGPCRALVGFFWHYPTFAVEVWKWGMVMSHHNPSIGQQVRKFGMPDNVYTHDFYPWRSRDGASDKHHIQRFGNDNFQRMRQLCADLVIEMLKVQKYAVLLGEVNNSTFIPELKKTYRLEKMYVNLTVTMFGEQRPHFWLVMKKNTNQVKQVVFPFWHLSYLHLFRKPSMKNLIVADFFFNAIGEISGVPVQNNWSFSEGLLNFSEILLDPSGRTSKGRRRKVSTNPGTQKWRRTEFKKMSPEDQQLRLALYPLDHTDYWGADFDPWAAKKPLRNDSRTKSGRYSDHRKRFNRKDFNDQEAMLKKHPLNDSEYWGQGTIFEIDESGSRKMIPGYIANLAPKTAQEIQAGSSKNQRTRFNRLTRDVQDEKLEAHPLNDEDYWGPAELFTDEDGDRKMRKKQAEKKVPDAEEQRLLKLLRTRQNRHRNVFRDASLGAQKAILKSHPLADSEYWGPYVKLETAADGRMVWETTRTGSSNKRKQSNNRYNFGKAQPHRQPGLLEVHPEDEVDWWGSGYHLEVVDSVNRKRKWVKD